MSESPNICGFKGEATGQFPADGKIYRLRIGRPQFVVKPEGNLLQRVAGSADGWSVRKWPGRRWIQKNAIRAGSRNNVQCGEACASVNRLHGSRIAHHGIETERPA